jgi:carboxymethylenebutenolidase
MKRRQRSVSLVFSVAMAIAAAAFAQDRTAAGDPHADHMMGMQQPASPGAVASRNPNLPPAGDLPGDKDAEVKKQLSSSPRKSEWVSIKANGPTPIKSFVVYPERRDKAPVVIVVMEIFGLTDWIRGVADQLAKEGFIAIAPDFLSGLGPNAGGSAELGEEGSRGVIGRLTDDDKVRILNDVRAYALALPQASGKVGVVGFCWGGGTAFLYARKQPALDAAVSYYGPMPSDAAEFANTKAPVLGLYGGNDNRVDANIDVAKAGMAKAGAVYEPHVFDGAGHGFLRAQNGTGPGAGNMKATEQAWPLTLEWLRKYTK